MRKKLIKHGNSTALVLDKTLLDLLGADVNTRFEVTTDGRNLILSPEKTENSETDVLASLEKINRKYHRALDKLGNPAE